jgi:hypothetical protein
MSTWLTALQTQVMTGQMGLSMEQGPYRSTSPKEATEPAFEECGVAAGNLIRQKDVDFKYMMEELPEAETVAKRSDV